jgi:hypothetical protein
MPDRLPHALRYKAQGFWPLPTVGKIPERKWKGLQSRQLTAQEMHEAWPLKGDANVALVCGPPAHVLVLNINQKNGVDGHSVLRQRGLEIPRTPEVITPSSTGRAYLFKVPDIDSPFRLHNYPKGWKGIELRGAGAIQVMPPSRLQRSAYRFADGWTLERLMLDLGDLPAWLLDLWITLDRSAKIFGPDEPVTIGNTRNPAPTAVQPTDLSPPSPPQPQKRSQPRPAPPTGPTTPNYTTITTRLSSDAYRVFVDGFDLRERECAEVLCLRVGLSVEALDDGCSFLCRLPGHRESTPSAQWGHTETGYYIYKDHHARSSETVYTVPEIYAALISGVVESLPRPSRMAWRLRLMVEEGWLTPEPVRMKPLPDDASPLLQRYCAGFRLLIACKSCHPRTMDNAATAFSKNFAARWCGIPKGSVWATQQEAIQRDLIVFAGVYKGQALYRPGKDE